MDHGATYCSVTLLNKEGHSYFSKSSSDAWLKIYIDQNLYLKCHLMKEASRQLTDNTKGFVFLW